MIEKMKLCDYDEVKDLIDQVHELHYKNRADIYINGDPLPFEYFRNSIENEESFNYVYRDGIKIVGVLMATKQRSKDIPILNERTVCFINDIVVDGNYRRKGIGKRLYNFLLESTKVEKIAAIELNVWAFNDSALKFYESLGMSVKNMKLEAIIGNCVVDVERQDVLVTEKVS